MKKSFFAFFIFLSICTFVTAQTPAKQKAVLHSINQIGLANGSTGSSFLMQSILGGSVKQSFAGIGLGIDSYRFRSVPLFVDVRYELSRKLQSLFFYGDIGYNLPWLTDQQKSQLQYPVIHVKASLYVDAGLGYRLKIDKDALLLSIGYSYKELKNRVNEYACTGLGCGLADQTYRYHMPRIVVKAGWQF